MALDPSNVSPREHWVLVERLDTRDTKLHLPDDIDELKVGVVRAVGPGRLFPKDGIFIHEQMQVEVGQTVMWHFRAPTIKLDDKHLFIPVDQFLANVTLSPETT